MIEAMLSGLMLLVFGALSNLFISPTGQPLLWRHWRYNAITMTVCCLVFVILRYIAYSLIDQDLTGGAGRSMSKAEFMIISLLMLGLFKGLHAREINDHIDYSVVGVIILAAFILPNLFV